MVKIICHNCGSEFEDKFFDLMVVKNPDIPVRIYCDNCINKLWNARRK